MWLKALRNSTKAKNIISTVRRQKRPIFLVADAAVLILAAWLSFMLRFEGSIPFNHWVNVYTLMAVSVAISLPIFYWQRLYHFTWSYVSVSDLYRVVRSAALANVLVIVLIFVLRDWAPFVGFPRSVAAANFCLSIIFIGGLRISKRLFVEVLQKTQGGGKRVLIVGAGEAGTALARSIIKGQGYDLVGFVDDNTNKLGTRIYNYPVLGNRQALPQVLKKYEVEEVIIAFSYVHNKIIRETVQICRDAGFKNIKILPSSLEILSGRVTLSNVRDISIEDLLGREKIQISTKEISNFLSDKVVMVTGGAGSIGSQLCQQVLKFNPSLLIAIDKDETGIFHLERKLNTLFPAVKKVFVVGNICNEVKMDYLFKTYKPQVVFHAAAYKHVPVMEYNPEEAIQNNIFGTLVVGQMAARYNAEKFVAISTDKAINPTSMMGASKRVTELICQYLNAQSPTNFCAVRFGNVLDSQGNVVGIFKDQIKQGGPVTITSLQMKRYFMVTSEACLLVMQAGALGQGGEVFVLDMGEPIMIADLAKEMIKLSGYEPEIDIEIIETGLRPGEKLFEEIMSHTEIPTKHERIFVAQLQGVDGEMLLASLKEMRVYLGQQNYSGLPELVKKLVPEFDRSN